MIEINKINDTAFEVTVQGEKTTSHMVTVDPGYHQKLTGGSVSAEELVEKSFQFLLERESNASILSKFNLEVIKQYFPEYEDMIRGMIG